MPQLLLEFVVLAQYKLATQAGACPANIIRPGLQAPVCHHGLSPQFPTLSHSSHRYPCCQRRGVHNIRRALRLQAMYDAFAALESHRDDLRTALMCISRTEGSARQRATSHCFFMPESQPSLGYADQFQHAPAGNLQNCKRPQ